MTTILETERLLLRKVAPADAAFVHALLTDPEYLANIGPRGVTTVEDAARAIHERFAAAYARQGFGMYVVEGKAEGVPLGMCGLVRREGLDHVDLGFAFLPAARGQSYAREAGRGVLDWAAARGLAPVVGIVRPENAASIAVLEHLGFVGGALVRLPSERHDVRIYAQEEGKGRCCR